MINYLFKTTLAVLIFVRNIIIMEMIFLWGVAATGKILAFLSGNGGVGRSALCAYIAAALSQQGRRVLCIDCDAPKGCLEQYLDIRQEMALSFLDLCRGDYALDKVFAHPRLALLRFASAPILFDPRDLPLEDFGDLVRQAAQRFDFVLLDGGSLGSSGFRLASQFCDQAILVTGFDGPALLMAHRAAQSLEVMGKTNVRLIVNRAHGKLLRSFGLTVDDIMDRVGLPLLGLVPEDPAVPLSATGLSPFPGKKPAFAACSRIAMRLQGTTVPISIR